MKLKALITALVLGATSTAALADHPVTQYDLGARGELSLRDHRGILRPAWTPLAKAIRAGGRKAIRVSEQRDDLSAIRLQNGTGATYIYSLTLRYDDGTREKIDVRKWLYSREPILTFDLPQQRGGLDRIVVSSFSWDPSTFQIAGKQLRPIYPEPRPLPPAPPPQVGFVAGKDLSFANSDGYVHVPVGSDKGRFTKLQIKSTGPSTFIGHLHVTYATGAHQTIDVNRALYRGELVTLDLEGKGPQPVTAVTVMAHMHDVRAVSPAASRFDVTLL